MEDLDFKKEFKKNQKGGTGEAKRDLAGDVAALANTAGGIIVLGVDEDALGRAAAAPGVDVTDGEAVRMRQVVAANIAPMPTIYIKKVLDSGPVTGPGFFVIAVPPSPMAPHAVLINDGKGLRYPRRNGASIRYLSEPEVATAYRSRDLEVVRQSTRTAAVAEDAIPRLIREEPWLLLTLVPDIAGYAPITSVAFEEFKASIVGSDAMALAGAGVTYVRAQVGRRSYIADDTNPPRAAHARWTRMQVYSDGSGSFALRLHDTNRTALGLSNVPDDSEPPLIVNDEWLAVGLLSGLLRLGQHARDRAATSGNALLRFELVMPESGRAVELGWSRSFGGSRPSTATLGRPFIAEAAVEIDAIATAGPDLVAASARVGSEIVQAFGFAELLQFTVDGRIPFSYWDRNGWRVVLSRWAKEHGVTIVE
jgi:hypothetical protein